MATLRPDGNYNLVGETNTLWGCPETHVETLVNAEQRRESQRLQAVQRAEEARLRSDEQEAARLLAIQEEQRLTEERRAKRLTSLKEGFTQKRGDFMLKLISNINMLEEEIAWYNNLVPDANLTTSSPAVYGYSEASKGGVQWQGTCSSEETADWLSSFFEVIDRKTHFELNGSDTWRDLIELGLARVGHNVRMEDNEQQTV
jgi:hypothetical protein